MKLKQAVIVILVIFLLAGGYSWLALKRTLPPTYPAMTSSKEANVPAGQLDWPKSGQAAIRITGGRITQTYGKQVPVPTASTAKLITVLTVLNKKPLQPGEQGPRITLTGNDVALYMSYLARDGSVVPVKPGEQITQYQMLQAVLLPSANNMADSLAIWAYGSLPAYAKAANAYLKERDLKSTHVGSDASGLMPDTTSTAADLAQLGEIAISNPVIADIVNQKSAQGIPVAGTIKNVNSLLGQDGIIGIKTGNSEQAGGVFVGAARTRVNGQPVTFVTAVAGAPNLFASLKYSWLLIKSAQTNFKSVTVVKKGQIVGRYQLPWGGSVTATASKNITLKAWGGSHVTAKPQLGPIPPNARAGQTVGSVSVIIPGTNTRQSVPVVLKNPANQPTLQWRLRHPL